MAKIIDSNLSNLSITQCPGTLVYMPLEALKEHPTYGTELDVYSWVFIFSWANGPFIVVHLKMTTPHFLMQKDVVLIQSERRFV